MSVAIEPTPTPDEVAAESQRVGNALVAQGEYLLALGRDLMRQSALLQGRPPVEQVSKPRGVGADHSVGDGGMVTLERAHGIARDLGRFSRTDLGAALGLKGVQVSKWLAQLLDAGLIERAVDEESHATVFDYVRKVEDEDALYQVRVWAQGQRQAFTGGQAVDATELPEHDVAVALTQLSAEGVLTQGRVEQVGDLTEVDQLGEVTYRYTPPLPAGVAGHLERQRLEQVTAVPEVKRGQPVRIRTERKTAQARSTPGSRSKIKNNERRYQDIVAAQEERAKIITAKNEARRAKDQKRREARKKRTGGGGGLRPV